MGNRLRELRKEKGLTLRDLAEKVNMSFSNIATLERGDSQLREDTARLFADFFNVSSDYLLGLSDNRNPVSTPSVSPVQDEALIALYNQTEGLTKEQMEQVISYVQFLKSKGDN